MENWRGQMNKDISCEAPAGPLEVLLQEQEQEHEQEQEQISWNQILTFLLRSFGDQLVQNL
jgi:hypothetical protein